MVKNDSGPRRRKRRREENKTLKSSNAACPEHGIIESFSPILSQAQYILHLLFALIFV
jgi:hypothetical protein